MENPNPFRPPAENTGSGGNSSRQTVAFVAIMVLNLLLIQAIIILAIFGLAFLIKAAAL